MSSFSSKDFHKTKSALEPVEVPEAPHAHRQVARAALHGDFSSERDVTGVAIVDLPTKAISVTIGHLNPEASDAPTPPQLRDRSLCRPWVAASR